MFRIKIDLKSSNAMIEWTLRKIEDGELQWERDCNGDENAKCQENINHFDDTSKANFIDILLAALAPKFFCQKLQNQIVIREKLCKALLHTKDTHKMLMKLTPSLQPLALHHKNVAHNRNCEREEKAV